MSGIAHSASGPLATVGGMRSVVLVMFALALVACGDDDEAATMTTVAAEVATQPSTSAPPAVTTAVTTGAVTTSAVTASAVTTSAPSSTVPPGAVVPEGFEQVAATVTEADGTVCELCLWLAATGDQRALGLMYVTHLGGPDGMVFHYDEPTTSEFWMKDTVMPLSIAFFDQAGAYLDAFDMAPCAADPCPTYRTPANFVNAIEVPQGMLGELGLAPGSVLALNDLPCGV